MTRKSRRMALVGLGLAALGAGTALVLTAMGDALVFFFSPSEIKERGVAANQRIRLGGLVEVGSVDKAGGTVTFTVTDTVEKIPVRYTGVLPDLFREGQGIVAEGRVTTDGVFEAVDVPGQTRRKLYAARSGRCLEKERSLAARHGRRHRLGRAMIAELGLFALALALPVALIQSIVPLIGASRGVASWMDAARPAALLQLALVMTSFGALTWCFVNSDFSVIAVFQNSHTAKPLLYKISGVWEITKDQWSFGSRSWPSSALPSRSSATICRRGSGRA